MARRLIDESGREIEIEYTGLRRGEKLHEVLFSSAEHGVASEHPLITRVAVPPLAPSEVLLDADESGRIGDLLRSQSSASVDAEDESRAHEDEVIRAPESLRHRAN
jgi:dTDP-glucose 4,6-dehydratase